VFKGGIKMNNKIFAAANLIIVSVLSILYFIIDYPYKNIILLILFILNIIGLSINHMKRKKNK
jgi:hypothetical protein